MRIIHKWLCLLSAALLTSCNNDVFIEDFLPETEPVNMTEGSGETTIRFEADNWNLLRVTKEGISYLNGTVRDLEGHPYGHYLPLENGELAIVSFAGDYYEFTIEKRESRTLSISLNENLFDEPFTIEIEVGNPFEQKKIPVTFSAGEKYRIDSIAYEWAAFNLQDSQKSFSYAFTINNSQSDKPVSYLVSPYDDSVSRREITFSPNGAVWGLSQYERYFGSPLPQVRIPELNHDILELGDTEVEFGMRTYLREEDLDMDIMEKVTVEPGKRKRVEIYHLIETYKGPYRVYASKPSTGKRLLLSGTISSKRTKGYQITTYDIE